MQDMRYVNSHVKYNADHLLYQQNYIFSRWLTGIRISPDTYPVWRRQLKAFSSADREFLGVGERTVEVKRVNSSDSVTVHRIVSKTYALYSTKRSHRRTRTYSSCLVSSCLTTCFSSLEFSRENLWGVNNLCRRRFLQVRRHSCHPKSEPTTSKHWRNQTTPHTWLCLSALSL